VCSAATIDPPVGSPSPTSPAYTIQLNGYDDVQVDGSASSDPDNAVACGLNQALFYQWTLLYAPAGSTAMWATGNTTTTMAAPTLNTDLDGTYDVQLVVSDGTFLSAPMTIRIQR
jgi:hypothetical protein